MDPRGSPDSVEKIKIPCLCWQSYSVVVQLNYLAFYALHSYFGMPCASNLN
jgi:hypothetical protein